MAKNHFGGFIQDSIGKAEDIQSSGQIVDELRNNTAALQSANTAIAETKQSVEKAVGEVDEFVKRIEAVPDRVREALAVTIPPETITGLSNVVSCIVNVMNDELRKNTANAISSFNQSLTDSSTNHAKEIDTKLTAFRQSISNHERKWEEHEKKMVDYETTMLNAARRMEELDHRISVPVTIALFIITNTLTLLAFFIIALIGCCIDWNANDFHTLAWWSIGAIIALNAFAYGLWRWQTK
ncbi:hypothetical protein [Bacteroides uniformis]|uniref:hypothetical protein n=1 Tax=Bacteroides uniformis TaxID=820 RepID=UPI001D0832A9|nr:hypothetical protein [Bacteroides uniformis]MCB6980517.1 hypothetical protein [Bacteroides uniformis]MCB7028326.1 hypothetical protein [Bacteroides uniformis]